MDGILSINRLSAHERTAIAELSEYGVSIQALADSLQASIKTAEQQQQQQANTNQGNPNEKTLQQTSSSLKDTAYTLLYNLLFTALKSVVANKRELQYDARLRNLLREVSYVVFDASNMGIPGNDDYERSKIKSLLLQEVERGAAQQIWNEISKSGAASQQQSHTQNVESSYSTMSWQAKWLALGAATVGGGLVIGLTGGIAAPILSAGLGSIFTYAGMTGVIATGIVEGLGSAGGAVALATFFGVTGGSTTAYSISRRLKDVEDMELVPVMEQNPSMHITICVSGFLFSNADVSEAWSVIPAYVPFSVVEALQFESKCLLEVGAALRRFVEMRAKVEQLASDLPGAIVGSTSSPQTASEAAGNKEDIGGGSSSTVNSSVAPIPEADEEDLTEWTETSPLLNSKDDIADSAGERSARPSTSGPPPRPRQASTFNLRTSRSSRPSISTAPMSATASTFATLASTIAWPVSLIGSGYIVDNPWELGIDRAEKVGSVLAREILLNRLRGHRPVTLVGFSLGAYAIFHALLELATAGEALETPDPYAIVDSVYLLGLPVPNDPELWRRAISVVNGRCVNAYAPNDWVLQFLYRAPLQTEFPIAGLAPVPRPSVRHNPDDHHDIDDVSLMPLSLSSRDLSATRPSLSSTSSTPSSAAHRSSTPHEDRASSTTTNNVSSTTTTDTFDNVSPTPNATPVNSYITTAASRWIENIDLSHIIDHHLHYLDRLPTILDYIGFERPSMATREAAAASDAAATSSTDTIVSRVSSTTRASFSGTSSATMTASPAVTSSPLRMSVSRHRFDTTTNTPTTTTDTANTNTTSDEILFENPYIDEDVIVHGIYASEMLAAEAASRAHGDDDDDDDDDDADHPTPRTKKQGNNRSYTSPGVPFGRQPRPSIPVQHNAPPSQ